MQAYHKGKKPALSLFFGDEWRKCRGREGMLFSKREDWKEQRSKHMSHVIHSQGFAWISCHSITYVSKSKTREGGHSWCRYSWSPIKNIVAHRLGLVTPYGWSMMFECVFMSHVWASAAFFSFGQQSGLKTTHNG